MGILLVCMSVYHVHAWCPWRPEQSVRCLGTRDTDSWEPLCGCWESNLDPLEGLHVVLTAESSLQPRNYISYCKAMKLQRSLCLIYYR